MNKLKNYLCCTAAILIIGSLTAPAVFAAPSAYPSASIDILTDLLSEIDPNYEPEPVYSSEDFGYQLNEDDTVTITEYTGESTDIEIPAEIDSHPVSTIGSRAFEYCKIGGSLSFPAGIEIEGDAFAYAELPSTITIPEGTVVGKEAFAYCEGLQILVVESTAVITERAFNYSEDLKALICADQVVLQDRAFEYCHDLEYVYLCGNVETQEDTFGNCEHAEISAVAADQFALLPAEVAETISSQDAEKDEGKDFYSVGEMIFYVPATMEVSSQPGYELYLIDKNYNYALGAAAFPKSRLDFEKDEDIETMVKTAEDYVTVENTYKVTIDGLPAVWMDICDKEDPNSVGVYLYIDAEDQLYHLMYLNIQGSRDGFQEIADSITITAFLDGNDLG